MPTLSVNTHFPGYEILGELGHSNARVLKARHVASGAIVAIKHFTGNTDDETLRRFQQESTIMTTIRHPNVVAVREVQLDRPLPFIVMEWIEGGDLRTLLTRHERLDVPTLIRLGLQMAGAFSAMHPRGIVHRDIKPENILYRLLPSGELHFLLTDFGVARLNELTSTLTGRSLMTCEYAAPEQFDNPRGVTAATDYYALGVVLHECLTGRVPFSLTESGMASFMNQVLQSAPPVAVPQPGQYLPPSLYALLNWALIKEPDQRLNDVDELILILSQASIERLQAGRPNHQLVAIVPPKSPKKPGSATSQRAIDDPLVYSLPASAREYWWGVVVGLTVTSILFGLIYYYRPYQHRPNDYRMTNSTLLMPPLPESDSGTINTDTRTDLEGAEPPMGAIDPDSATTPPVATTVSSLMAGKAIETADTTMVRDTTAGH